MDICEQWREAAMAYLDGELEMPELERFEGHLASCPTCARVLEEYKQVKEVTGKMKLPEPSPEYWEEYPKGIVAKMSRGLGWIFYVAGLLILFLYSLYQLLRSPEDAILKIAVMSIIIGFLFLLFSVIRSRCQESKSDRYSKEVHK